MNKDSDYRTLYAYTYYLSVCITKKQSAKNWNELTTNERDELLKVADSAVKSFTSIQVGDPERN